MSTAVPFKYFMNKFQCFYCSEVSDDFEVIRSHNKTQHDALIAKRSLKTLKGTDFRLKLEVSDLRCKICEATLSITSLVDHITALHDAKCDHSILNILLPFKIVKDRNECPICLKPFVYFARLLGHMNDEHSNSEYLCDICGRTFINKINHTIHMSRYHRLHKCTDCNDEFQTIAKLRLHQSSIHGLKTYKCTICGEKFSSHYKKQKHSMKVHGGGFSCSFCGLQVTKNSHLINHINRSHLKEKKVQCNVCNERFFNNTLLKIHMAKHAGLRNFHCDICGKAFIWKRNLKCHISLHSVKRLKQQKEALELQM
jgi:hypothetical protein